jgi:hypothetical protein
MAKRKRNLTPDELAELRTLVAQLRREVAELMSFVQAKLAKTA